jgi:rSAM/selenodomain-associated transferase 1
MPTKQGYKQIKRVGLIAYTKRKPADDWTNSHMTDTRDDEGAAICPTTEKQVDKSRRSATRMPYPILDPSRRNPALAPRCALAVMAKAPRPGKVKTRLSPPLTIEQAAALNICFLKDSANNITEVAATGGASGLVCYTPVGDESLFDSLLPDGFALIVQRGDGFGERLLAAAADILACGFGAVCLINSDSPTLPANALRQAVEELNRPGDRIVLGGSSDGGYYLIGLKAPHSEPFAGIHWSTSTVYAETVAAIAHTGIELVELPAWYDVDDGETLKLLQDELLRSILPPFASVPGYPASYSRSFLLEAAGVSK